MTKIGVISDTHDNYMGTKKAVEIFKKVNVDFIVHLGDLISPPMLKCFEGIKLKLCLGNNEGELFFLMEKLKEIDAELFRYVCEFEADGKKVAAYHGQSSAIIDALVNCGKYDYVLIGHVHKIRDERKGKVRIVNPGTLFLGDNDKTIAVLDTAMDKVEFYRVS
ncbi:YfcE family phosphodiesterase [Candidatus Woesearchaeota archaeon CG10_big_fil_rev_8_21_14_0_10_44_13]|nr:MAG: YfcE family phosphodiesterase [Candidatus Woesearchaeota archaeon CG10_big_fil_rev_8_21_14_0_10_44_13]